MTESSSSWKTAILSEVATIERVSVGPSEIAPDAKYVGLEHVNERGELVDVDRAHAAQIKSNKFAFGPGHVLYGKLRPYLSKIATPSFAGVCSTDILPIRPSDRLDRRFLYHYLRTPHMIGHASRLATGASLPRLSPKALAAFPIPLPPIEEQRRIAAVLDAAEDLRAKRREAFAKLNTFAQAIFIDMFGDPVNNPKSLPTARLEDVFEIARGGSPRPIQEFLTDDVHGINWVMIGDALEGAKYITSTAKRIRPAGEKRSRRVHPGDLLLTNSMSFGRPYIMKVSGCIHDGWLVLSPRADGISSDYFHAALGMKSVYEEFVRRAPGATVKNLNIDLVRSLVLPVPSADEQQRFTDAIRRVEALGPELEASRDSLDGLFGSLQQRAFAGDL